MKVACIENHWHEVTPTALAIILSAYFEGDLQTVGREGVVSLCMVAAFTRERVIAFQQKWPGHVISFDRRNPLGVLADEKVP